MQQTPQLIASEGNRGGSDARWSLGLARPESRKTIQLVASAIAPAEVERDDTMYDDGTMPMDCEHPYSDCIPPDNPGRHGNATSLGAKSIASRSL